MYRRHAFQPGQQREVTAYRMAEQRCINPNDPCYKDFGGKGVEFRFKSFKQFWDEIGPRPADRSGKLSAYSLGRIDVNGHFEPGNVAWVRRGSTRRSKLYAKKPSLSPKAIADFAAAHPDMTYEKIGLEVGASISQVYAVMKSLGIRRPRGKRPEIPVPGTRFGMWTVVSAERQGAEKDKGAKWLCKCDCGTERWVRANNMKFGKSTNCGCVPKDLTPAWTPEKREEASKRATRFHIEHPEAMHFKRKLTVSQIRKIRHWYAMGVGYGKLGEHYGVSATTIKNIVKEKTYKER